MYITQRLLIAFCTLMGGQSWWFMIDMQGPFNRTWETGNLRLVVHRKTEYLNKPVTKLFKIASGFMTSFGVLENQTIGAAQGCYYCGQGYASNFISECTTPQSDMYKPWGSLRMFDFYCCIFTQQWYRA